MKIPIFEEILLNELTAEKLRIIVSDSRIGKKKKWKVWWLI